MNTASMISGMTTADMISAVSALATLAAVVAAFAVQRMQARADKRLALYQRNEMELGAASAGREAVKAVRITEVWAREMSGKSATDTAYALRRADEALAYYLNQEIADFRLIDPLIKTKVILAETKSVVDALLSQPSAIDDRAAKARLLATLEARKGSIEHADGVLFHLYDVYSLKRLPPKRRRAHPASRAAKAESEAR